MRGEFMKTEQKIKGLREALQSCRALRAYAAEIGPIITGLKTLATKHQKQHGGTCHRKLIDALRDATKAIERAIDSEVRSSERVIRSIIAEDDDLKRTPHVDVSRRGNNPFRGRHTSTAQQRLSGPWGEQ
jgi:hypothetical protein